MCKIFLREVYFSSSNPEEKLYDCSINPKDKLYYLLKDNKLSVHLETAQLPYGGWPAHGGVGGVHPPADPLTVQLVPDVREAPVLLLSLRLLVQLPHLLRERTELPPLAGDEDEVDDL